MNYKFLMIALLAAGVVRGSDDAPEVPKIERRQSFVHQASQQELFEEERLELLKREAQQKLEATFVESAKTGKRLSQFLAMNLNINAKDSSGKTALMHLVIRFAECHDEYEKADLLKTIEALLGKKAMPFGERDKSQKNAWDYAEGHLELQSLMMKMHKQDYVRRSSVDETMKKVLEIYGPEGESKEK